MRTRSSPFSANRARALVARVVLSVAAASLAAGSTACGGGLTEPEEDGHTCLDLARFGDPAESLYVLPYSVGAGYPVLQSYCSPRPQSHWYQFAYDFTMPIGSEVVAARGGRVLRVEEQWSDADRNRLHLNRVDIGHADGTSALYAHLQQNGVVVEVGDTVVAGQLIAHGGSSAVRIPLLHFQVYRSWNPRDELGADVPVNFRNADGPLGERGGLQEGTVYTALPY